jgi:hypothetical protein
MRHLLEHNLIETLQGSAMAESYSSLHANLSEPEFSSVAQGNFPGNIWDNYAEVSV